MDDLKALVETETARLGVEPAAGPRLRLDAPPPVRPPPAIPRRFTDARFATYRAETPSEQLALRAVERWVDAHAEGPMLALIGPQGTGKSHLLYAAVWALHESGVWCPPRAWYQLADALRYGTRGTEHEGRMVGALEAHEVRERLWAQRIVVLDEVRPTANTPFDDTELAKLACHCYDQMLPVLLTTNVSPLGDVLGPAAASRFTQLTLVGRDRRQPTEAQRRAKGAA